MEYTIEFGKRKYYREQSYDTRFDKEVEQDLIFLTQNIHKLSLKNKENIKRLAKKLK